MTKAEQASKGDDYAAMSRITRDRKLINKGWKWAATSDQLGQAHRQVVSERCGDDSHGADAPGRQMPKSSRSSKRRKSNSYSHAIIERAKTLAHAAPETEPMKKVAARRLGREAEEQAILHESRMDMEGAADSVAPR